MELTRMEPDTVLKMINRENKLNENSHKGKLKIFFGYAAGVGKTYSMLRAAHDAQENGVNVLVGYIEPHTRPQTMKLLEGLVSIPPLQLCYKGLELNEFNLDLAIEKKPDIILVDELAHTNVKGLRHDKRYQDIEELLNMGIDVYTTVNVQHIESLNDIVEKITDIRVRERIPDKIFDEADNVELVDIEPEELLRRLKDGKIYKTQQARLAMSNFFTHENLISLREVALRRMADRVNIKSEVEVGVQGKHFADEHVLVCLSSSPSNKKIIRTAARLSKAFKCRLSAVYVETTYSNEMSDEDKERLIENTNLASKLGAITQTVYGEDIAYQISEFARLSGVSKIVIGRGNTKRKFGIKSQSFVDMLIKLSPYLDIYIIPDKDVSKYEKKRNKVKRKEEIKFRDVLITTSIPILSTIIGIFFRGFGMGIENIIVIFILGVIFSAVLTSKRIYSVILSFISVVVFNYFFTEPLYSFRASYPEYPVTFIIMLLAGLFASTLASKLKEQAKLSTKTVYRTSVLLETNELIQKEKTDEGIISVVANQLIKIIDKDVIIYKSENGELINPTTFSVDGESDVDDKLLSQKERAVAEWVFKNNKRAGVGTGTLNSSICVYYAVRGSEGVYGVLGVDLSDGELDNDESNLLHAIISVLGVALERQVLVRKNNEAIFEMKNEQIRGNLLRGISHDLRTPLTAISGNADVLMKETMHLSDEKRNKIYKDIYDDSIWLINLIENILSVTKIEDGSMKLNLEPESLEEVINEALRHIDREKIEHTILTELSDEIIVAKVDARLIMQVITNLVDNAIKYTKKGSMIKIKLYKESEYAIIEVSDDGDGITDINKKMIFDKYFTQGEGSSDSRRGIGLGLPLCKTIVEAHGGKIMVLDNEPKGAVFRFMVKAESINMTERNL